MALWDTADILARCKLESGLPASTTFPSDANWYTWLTRAEAYWKPKLASQYPYHMFGAPTLITSADSGVTYTFGSEASPLAVEVYTSLTGTRLRVGQFGDSNGDYVWEGSQIRMPGNTARVFANGPYARWVTSPTTIDGSTQPTIKPTWTRQLLVDRALIYYARTPPGQDAERFELQEAETWANVQESLKNSNPFYGDAANSGGRVSGVRYLGLRSR